MVTQLAIVRDDGNGTLTTKDGVELAFSDPDCPGDGTVPMYSGAAPAGKAGVEMVFAHGHEGHSGEHNQHFGYDHQDSYNDDQERSLYATMYAVIKIAQQAQWHKREGSE